MREKREENEGEKEGDACSQIARQESRKVGLTEGKKGKRPQDKNVDEEKQVKIKELMGQA